MDSIKVIIENWPTTNYLINSIPIIIAIIALIVSLYSVYLTRKSFIASYRPYVWAMSYGVIDQKNKTIIPVPHKLAYRVKNSPAKIIFSKIKIDLNDKELFSDITKNLVRFPDDTSEWAFGISEEQFQQIMNHSPKEKSNLIRIISLKYSSINGGNVYSYNLRQTFNPKENQWKDFTIEAT